MRLRIFKPFLAPITWSPSKYAPACSNSVKSSTVLSARCEPNSRWICTPRSDGVTMRWRDSCGRASGARCVALLVWPFEWQFAMLLVYLVLAGQYESWFMPVAVLLAVPLSLVGPVSALKGLGIDNNLYTQIGLVLLIALSAKNAILIVEVARERRIFDGKPIIEAALEAARARFRPILMTSFAFILGVLPLVLATGAGANSRKSIGIAVSSGMLASTCLAVLFVPSFFVVVRQFEEWRAARKSKAAAKAVPVESRASG